MARRIKGEGSLYQAKDKSWIYQYRVNGQRKTKRFRRKSDALEYIKAHPAGTDDQPSQFSGEEKPAAEKQSAEKKNAEG